MAISWGPYTNYLRIGIDVWTDGYNTWTPSINVYVAYYVQCSPSYNFADNQTLVLLGNAGGSYGWFNDLQEGQTRHIATYVVGGQGQSYGGGPTYHFAAQLDGVYLGAGPSHGINFTLPARPIRPPSAPGAPVASGITANGATFSWGSPSDVGGAALDYSWLELATANWANVIYSNQSPGWSGRTLSTLAPNSTYYMRAAAHNAAGWSPWSGVPTFSTLPFQVATPTLTGAEPTAATVNWAAPPGGTPTGWQIQVSRNSTFTQVDQTPSSSSWGTSRKITGLTPATKHYFRVRANTAYGFGAWSPAASMSTLSGAKLRVNGQWVDGAVYVRSAGAWVAAKVNKRVGGSWVL